MYNDDNCTRIPRGSAEFCEAVERLRNAPSRCTNIFDMATQCCMLCKKTPDCDCESCYVQTVGDLHDPYREDIKKNTSTGMYSSGMYKDKEGNYHYTHPQGSG